MPFSLDACMTTLYMLKYEEGWMGMAIFRLYCSFLEEICIKL